MGIQVILDPVVVIDSTTWSDHISKIEFDDSFEVKEKTTFGDGGAKRNLAGLESGTVQITFKNDYASGSINSFMWSRRRQVVPITAWPNNTTVSSNNPRVYCDMLIDGWKPLAGGVGDVAEVDRSFPMDGPMNMTTSAP